MTGEKLTQSEAGYWHAAASVERCAEAARWIDEAVTPPLVRHLEDGAEPFEEVDLIGPPLFSRWFGAHQSRPVGLQLVLLGALLVGRLERVAMRRRLAALLHRLPAELADEIRSRLEEAPLLQGEVERRINEVYCRIAASNRPADEELALVGLYFVVSSFVFRLNGQLTWLEENLPAALARRCGKYRRACLQSGSPELTPRIAQVVGGLLDELMPQQQSDTGEDCDG